MPATKKPRAERQHDNVQHGMFLCDVNRGPNATAIALIDG